MDLWQNVLAACTAPSILVAIMGVVYAIYGAVAEVSRHAIQEIAKK